MENSEFLRIDSKQFLNTYLSMLELTLRNSVNVISRLFRLCQSKLPRICFNICGPGKSSISFFFCIWQTWFFLVVNQYLKETLFYNWQNVWINFIAIIYVFNHSYTFRLVFRVVFPTISWSVLWLKTKICSAIPRKTKPLIF